MKEGWILCSDGDELELICKIFTETNHYRLKTHCGEWRCVCDDTNLNSWLGPESASLGACHMAAREKRYFCFKLEKY